MPAINKTESISAADFQAAQGRKPVVKKPINLGFDVAPLPRSTWLNDGDKIDFTFTYRGAVVSNNATFAGMHWTKRKALADKWHSIFRELMNQAGVQWMEKFKLHLRYNSRHDCDNLVLTTKLCVDAMKGVFVAEDSKKHYRGISIEPDETLPHNCFVFTIHTLT